MPQYTHDLDRALLNLQLKIISDILQKCYNLIMILCKYNIQRLQQKGTRYENGNNKGA